MTTAAMNGEGYENGVDDKEKLYKINCS